MEPIIGIYKITSPSGRVYIGQSWNIKKRWSHYKSDIPDLPQPFLHNSFVKYGAKNHFYEIICELPDSCSQKELDDLEIYYINLYRSEKYEMMNCTLGGMGAKGAKHSEESKKKLSEQRKGNKNPMFGKRIILSEDRKRRISEANTGKKRSLEFCIRNSVLRIGNTNSLGRKHSEETKKNMSLSRKGKPKKPFSPRVRVVNMTNGIIYDSIGQAAKTIGMCYDTLKPRLYGKIPNNTDFEIYEKDIL